MGHAHEQLTLLAEGVLSDGGAPGVARRFGRAGSAMVRLVASSVRWHPDAEQRLGKVPFFIRPWVRRRAESVARERGLAQVNSQLLDEIKGREHQPT